MVNNNIFEAEKNLVESVLEPEEILNIARGSTDDESVLVNVFVTPDEYIQSYVRPISKIGYEFLPEESSTKRLVFQKLNDGKIRLHLEQSSG